MIVCITFHLENMRTEVCVVTKGKELVKFPIPEKLSINGLT